MKLHTLKPANGARKKVKRIGRGQGSTRGGTSTKGHKGQQSRSGYNYRPWFEGGQMPLYRRIPKYGFTNKFRVEYKAVNLDTLQELSEKFPNEEINHEFLAAHGIIANSRKLVKVLGRGELKNKLEVKLNKASKSALAAIEKAGGTFTAVDAAGKIVVVGSADSSTEVTSEE
ncbi:MAG: 50S ribosomal protein L15 [Bacteroidota bacterium]